MTKYYVIGDIHGQVEPLKQLLRYWTEGEKLVFLGDYFDRGPYNKEVLELMLLLGYYYKEDCIFLRGNHDEMLYQVLSYRQKPIIKKLLSNEKENYKENLVVWLNNGGVFTLVDFLELNQELIEYDDAAVINKVKKIVANDKETINQLVQKQPKLYQFLKETKLYYQDTEANLLFVHAGIGPNAANHFKTEAPITEATKEELLWLREGFYQNRNPMKNTWVIFGHTPIVKLYYKQREAEVVDKILDCCQLDKLMQKEPFVAVEPYEKYIGIDTGTFFSGVLTGLKVKAAVIKKKQANVLFATEAEVTRKHIDLTKASSIKDKMKEMIYNKSILELVNSVENNSIVEILYKQIETKSKQKQKKHRKKKKQKQRHKNKR